LNESDVCLVNTYCGRSKSYLGLVSLTILMALYEVKKRTPFVEIMPVTWRQRLNILLDFHKTQYRHALQKLVTQRMVL